MAMHAAAVVAEKRFGHEGGPLALFLRNVPNGVLEELQVVSSADQRRVTEINFALTRRGNFMVMTLDVNPYLLKFGSNFTTKILQRIERRQWYVALFVSDVISLIAIPVLPVGIPNCLRAVQGVAGRVPIVMKVDFIKDEELCL